MLSSRTAFRSTVLAHVKTFSSFPPARFPVNPTGSTNANADTAHISRDKQGTGKSDVQQGGSASEGKTQGGSGGPSEQSGIPDPEISDKDASKAKEGMTSGSSDSASRN
ncbi:hypothetical protein IAR55_006370 [Kwoniella newhampshirensis]|uniref:Uncharacterized protein n=1 Tax=Kwoniella newhampshirensis TaxID=1651941 RepID=A0AAW0YU32_9TREE